MELGALAAVAARLDDDAKDASAEALGCRAAACEVAAELAAVDYASKNAVAAVAADAAVVAGLARACAAVATKRGDVLAKLAGAAHAARALRDLADEQADALLEVDPCCVDALATCLREALKHPKTTAGAGPLAAIADPTQLGAAIAGECVDYAGAALAQIARRPAARPRYAVAVKGETAASATPCGILLKSTREAASERAKATALVGVTNACLGDEGKGCLKATEAAGGVAEAFALVRAKATFDVEARARAAGLLARLATAGGHDGAAARTLRAAPKALGQLAAAVDAAGKRDDAWAALERDHLVRALAGVLGSEKKPASVRAFLDCGGYATLIRAMPEPRTDLGRVTAQSVVQTPLRPGTAHGAGNAAKVLLAALSNEDAATRTAVADGVVEVGGVERLVCSLAHFKDLSVRKNCAVALAKVMAARPESKDRVRELRGIEMITTLGDKLTK